MEVKQIYNVLNQARPEQLGESVVINEDLSNIVDYGKALFEAAAVDNYTHSLVDVIGKMVFVNRKYTSKYDFLLRDGWEYGSILAKVREKMPQFSINEDWALNDGEVYSQDTFYQPNITCKFFNKRVAFEVDRSIASEQVKEAFNSAQQLGSFFDMLYTSVNNAFELAFEKLAMQTVTGMMGATINDNGATRVYKILTEFNTQYSKSLTSAQALRDPEFLTYASMRISEVRERMQTFSTLFNIEGKESFTPKERMTTLMLSEFKHSLDHYLYYSNRLNRDLITIDDVITVPYWQGSGTDYGLASISKIDVKIDANTTIEQDNIIGCVFDKDAMGIANLMQKVTTHENKKGDFINYFYKKFLGLWNDYAENFCIFILE